MKDQGAPLVGPLIVSYHRVKFGGNKQGYILLWLGYNFDLSRALTKPRNSRAVKLYT